MGGTGRPLWKGASLPARQALCYVLCAALLAPCPTRTSVFPPLPPHAHPPAHPSPPTACGGAGQRDGVDIYHDHIATPDFISLKRLFRGGGGKMAAAAAAASSGPEGQELQQQQGSGGKVPVLNLEFLIDHVMHSVLPLDWDAVLQSPVPLKVRRRCHPRRPPSPPPPS